MGHSALVAKDRDVTLDFPAVAGGLLRIVREFDGRPPIGLGHLAVAKLQELKVAGLFAVIAVLALIGLTLYAIVGVLRRALIPWHAIGGAGMTARARDGASEAS